MGYKYGPVCIFKMQIKAIRIVVGMSYNSHAAPLFKKTPGTTPVRPNYIHQNPVHATFQAGFFLPPSFSDTFNYEIMISFSLYILTSTIWTYFPFLIFRKFGKTFLMNKSKFCITYLSSTGNLKIIS